MLQWPDDLVDVVARRKCVLYLGAGVSANSISDNGKKPPTWKCFLENIIREKYPSDRFLRDIMNKEQYLDVSEVLIQKMGEKEFTDLLQQEFRSPGFKHSDVHEAIYNLDAKIIITPNVDNIYERYALNQSQGTVVVKRYTERDISGFIRRGERVIIKAHGTLDNTSELIFSKRQYGEARCKYSVFYNLLEALMMTNTYIFLGCGINDPDIGLVLENYHYELWKSNYPHYFVCAENDVPLEYEKILSDNYNLKVLKYSNENGDYRNFLPALNELVKRVDNKRSDISESQDW